MTGGYKEIGLILTIIAICCLSLALMRSLQQRHRVSDTQSPPSWTPLYTPWSQNNSVKEPKGSEFAATAVNARRMRAKEIQATDNTEFILDLFAYRCKACSKMYVSWVDAFECHKGSSV